MPWIDDTGIPASKSLEIVKRVGRRKITHAIHDIDGTHSLIRDWPPVMSISIHWAMTGGLRDDFDSNDNMLRLIERVQRRDTVEECDRFCVESAGLSAITQMEFGIRRAIELGNVPPAVFKTLTDESRANNAAIIQRIWNGEERFHDVREPEALLHFINERTPRLFKLYETVLNGASRDKNTAEAWTNPVKWRVPGSMEFMAFLHELRCVNYFVTGAVIYEEGGMYEEVKALGFDIGPGRMVEAIQGSQWDKKLPKDEVMKALCREKGVAPENVLVIGDGRTEIKAGVDMGCVTLSRLPHDAARLREMHRDFGVHYIIEDYTDPVLKKLFSK